MKNRITIIAIALFSFSNALANNSVLLKLGEKENKIDSLYNLAWDYLYINPDSTIIIAESLADFSKKQRQIIGEIKSYYVTGYAYYLKNYFDISANYYYKGLDLIGSNNDPIFKERKMLILQGLGVAYDLTFNYDLAIKYYTDALKIAEELGFYHDMEILNYNIGVTYRKKELYHEAKQYYDKALKINERTKDYKSQSKIYNALGYIYHLQKNYEKANDMYLNALKISLKDQKSEKERARYLNNIGENYYFQNQFDLAKKYYLEGLEISKNHNDIEKIKWIYNNIGDVYLKENNLSEAINYYNKTIALGDTNALDEELQHAFKSIAEVLKASGEYKLALEYNSKYIAQTDKIVALKQDLSEQNAQYRMKELEWQREIMQKELMLASAEKENLWARVIIGVALLLILFSSRLIYLYYSKIAKARKIVNSYRVESFDF